MILQLAIGAAGGLLTGGIGADVKIAGVLLQIAQHAAAAYHAETGTPIDLSKIPQEDVIP